MLKEKIGVLIFALGVMSIDSQCLWFPIALVAIGIWLIRTSKEHEHE